MPFELSQFTYFSPADDCEAALLAFVETAQHSIRVADYGFNLPSLTDLLIAKHQAGVDVKLVLDRTEAHGPSERPIIAELRAAGVPLVEGTSERRRIMHHKFVVVDELKVLSGSYNFTHTASLESNYFDVITNPLRAQAFLDAWQRIWNWIEQYEPQKEST